MKIKNILFITLIIASITCFAQKRVLKQKTDTDSGWPGARVTYSYYIDNDGDEVRHGTTTSTQSHIKKHGGSWTGNEKVSFELIDGEMNGVLTASYNKKYWHSQHKWINGKRQEVFSLLADFIMPVTKFRVSNGFLDGKIDINTGLSHIIGEAKDGYWVGRLIIKGKDIKGQWNTIFNETCDPKNEIAEATEIDSYFYRLGGLVTDFHNIEGIYPYKITLPKVRYINEEMIKRHNKQKEEKEKQKAETERNYTRLRQEILLTQKTLMSLFYKYTYRRMKEDEIIVSEFNLNINEDTILAYKNKLDTIDYENYTFNDTSKLPPIELTWNEEIPKNLQNSFNLYASPKFNEVFGNENDIPFPINRGSGNFRLYIQNPTLYLEKHKEHAEKLDENKKLLLQELAIYKEKKQAEKQALLAVNSELQELVQQLNNEFKKSNSQAYDFLVVEDRIEFITNVGYGPYVRKFGEWEELKSKLHNFCYKKHKKTVELLHITEPNILTENKRISLKDESLGYLRIIKN
ncbi:hypothetical protein [Pedobacter sp. UBA4863]|uniref:hypothetical protein n=1 Tax=Pedobacter sp. UBA4863 TaxID=1947060 RepID=UPI0025EFE649|nr:hypothetical protein [Pedobacter sp. UBA4863]